MAFISKREEATNPFRRRSTVIKTVFDFENANSVQL
jgi:hypothetical protein